MDGRVCTRLVFAVDAKAVMACARLPGEGDRRVQRVREFGTFTAGLIGLRHWLLSEGVTQVVMKATGVYGRPVWHVLAPSDSRHPMTGLEIASGPSQSCGLKGDCRTPRLPAAEQ